MSVHKVRAKRLLEFQDLLVQFAEVERHIYFPDRKIKNRKENDSEHSYNLAMASWFLSGYFSHLDRDLLIRYALVHDFVEVYAGDVMAIGRTKKAEAAKQHREEVALKKLEIEWSDFPELALSIKDYEARQDPEAKFVYALDKIMPMILNLLSNGKTWKSYGMKQKDVLVAKDTKVTISPEVNEIWQVFRQQIIENPDYFSHELENK